MADQPNVLWIMADQHNARCTEWGDFPTEVHTPNLSRLCDRGVRFDRAFCQNPVCTPSRTSYWTGQYPSNHGVYATPRGDLPEDGFGGVPTETLPTLFSVAQDQGYRTGLFGKDHTPSGLLDDDVDAYYAGSSHREHLEDRGLLEDRDAPAMAEGVEFGGAMDGRPSNLDFEDHQEYFSTERAIEFVDEGDDPFCISLSYSFPHNPYTPAQEFWDQYPDAEDIDLAPSAFEDHEAGGKPPNQLWDHPMGVPEVFTDMDEASPWAKFDPDDHESMLRRKLRGYLGCITEVDALVGRVLDALEERGLREDTIVIYCSDHGDFATEHGFPEKGPGLSYDAITRIPFVWSCPSRFEEGRVVDELVETVDVFPTLCQMMGAGDPRSADGHDLAGYLTGEQDEPLREYAITENPWARCVRTKDQKLTYYPPGYFGEGSEAFEEFYDLDADPWETENVAETRPEAYSEAIHRHRDLLLEFLSTKRRPYAIQAHDVDSEPLDLSFAADGTVAPSTIEALLAREDYKRRVM
jgi:choline-sulfatase/uncharacterized sulfatase